MSNLNNRVIFINRALHDEMPAFYPSYFTIGKIIEETEDSYKIQWPKGSTSKPDCWFCDTQDVKFLHQIKAKKKKKKKSGHWVPVDPNNLPKEGTRVRYSRENIDWANSIYVEIGDTGTVQFWQGCFGFNLDVSKGMDWICILTQADCLDMWVEDDE